LSGERFTAAAYCRARRRLPLELFKELAESVGRRIGQGDDVPLWHGHRVFLMDGSGFSMPDTAELQAHFGQPGNQKPGCGFPVAHMLCLLDAEAGYLRDMIITPLRTQDIAQAADLHPKLTAGDIVVGDRGFCSYAHLALISKVHLHGLVRVHQKQIVDFHPHRLCTQDLPKGNTGIPTSRWVQRLGPCDQLVEWHKPDSRPKWMTAEQFDELPDKLLVRELKFRVKDSSSRVREITLVTTLLDPEKYPASELAALYRQRWQIEVDLRDLKTTLGMDVLKGKSLDVVMKEAFVFVLVYNLVRSVAVEAGRRQRVSPHRISFIDALRWLRPARAFQQLPELVVNPIRPGRIEPRCLKRRQKEYARMTRPRKELRKLLRNRRDAA
jgi:hypothetical protein